jgi:outer membrane lipoprotein SlyB
MNDTQPGRKLHPVLWIAATALTVFSVVGIASLTGLLPRANGGMAPAASAPAAPAQLNAAPVAADETAQPQAASAKAQPEAPAKGQPEAPARHPRKPVERAQPAAPKPIKVAYDEPPAPQRRAAYDDPPAPVLERAPGADRAPPRGDEPPARRSCRDCGVIESVRELRAPGEGTGLGAVSGGVLGGVLGHQVGGGRGRDVATVVGAVGGAIAGHQVEKNVRTGSKYEIAVRYDHGGSQVFEQAGTPAWRAGDRVRVVSGVIQAD